MFISHHLEKPLQISTADERKKNFACDSFVFTLTKQEVAVPVYPDCFRAVDYKIFKMFGLIYALMDNLNVRKLFFLNGNT